MEENFDAFEVIARTRGKVDMDSVPTGGKLFPLWGWLTAIVYSLEFLLWQLLHQEWCLWLWVLIPVIGVSLMILFIRKDRDRTHMRTRESRLVLDYWIFAACVFCLGGFLFGFTGVYEVVENPLMALLVGVGAFITGGAMRFRPMVVGGLAGATIGVCSFALQGELWVWQMLAIVASAVAALIVPGHLYQKSVNDGI